MNCLDLYKEIKAEGQVKNFYNSYQHILSADALSLEDIRQTILLALTEFLNSTKLNVNSNKDQLQKTANIIVQNNLKDILNSVAQEETREIKDQDPLDFLANLVTEGHLKLETIEYDVCCLKFVENLSWEKIAQKINNSGCYEKKLNKRKVQTILHNISVKAKLLFYTSKYVSFANLMSEDDNKHGVDDIEKCVEAGVIHMDSKDTFPEILWESVETLLDERSYDILRKVIVEQASFKEIGSTLNITGQQVGRIYETSLSMLRKKIKKVGSF